MLSLQLPWMSGYLLEVRNAKKKTRQINLSIFCVQSVTVTLLYVIVILGLSALKSPNILIECVFEQLPCDYQLPIVMFISRHVLDTPTCIVCDRYIMYCIQGIWNTLK